MDTKEFKALFAGIAKAHGFSSTQGGWYRELPAALFVLNLQKSNFGNYYELNLKLFLELGAPSDPKELKRMATSLNGDIFRRQPTEYRGAFDLDSSIDTAERSAALERMFAELVDRIASAATGPAGLISLRDAGVLYLLPGVESRLNVN